MGHIERGELQIIISSGTSSSSRMVIGLFFVFRLVDVICEFGCGGVGAGGWLETLPPGSKLKDVLSQL